MYCGRCGNKLQAHGGQCSNCSKVTGHSAKSATIDLKKWAIIVIAATLIIFLVPKVFGGSDMSSPKKTVAGFIKATKKMDVDQMYKFLVPDENISNSDLKFFKEQYKDMMKDRAIKIKDYKILSEEIDNKEATVEYRIEVQYEDEVETTEDTFNLIKVGDKWYIDESFFSL